MDDAPSAWCGLLATTYRFFFSWQSIPHLVFQILQECPHCYFEWCPLLLFPSTLSSVRNFYREQDLCLLSPDTSLAVKVLKVWISSSGSSHLGYLYWSKIVSAPCCRFSQIDWPTVWPVWNRFSCLGAELPSSPRILCCSKRGLVDLIDNPLVALINCSHWQGNFLLNSRLDLFFNNIPSPGHSRLRWAYGLLPYRCLILHLTQLRINQLCQVCVTGSVANEWASCCFGGSYGFLWI